jgi:membrane protein YqaA with SNARE-associated domain
MPVEYDKEKYGWHFHRYLYDWVLSWAESPLGGWALFILALAESSFFPIPPDVLLIAMVLSVRKKAFRFALICSIASIIGGMIGYVIGFELWYSGDGYSRIADFFFSYIPGFTRENFLAAKSWYDTYSFWIVFTAGFTPIPYKVITITAGVAKINLSMFFIASTISRTLRFFLVAGLIWRFGSPIKDFIETRFNLLTIIFVLLLVGGFILIKYVY